MSEKKLPKYILDLLDQISKDNGFNDYSIQVKKGSEHGDGFTSEISSILISENNSTKQLQLVCKLAPFNENRRKEFFADMLFDRETIFYKKVMPTFAKFQREKNLPEEDQFMAYPKCYAAICDREKEQYVIVLEDLRPKEFKMWNKAKIAPIENLQLAMREIGKFHGISIAMKDQKPQEFAEFEQITDFVRSIIKVDFFRGMFEASYDRAIPSLKKQNHKDIMQEIKRNAPIYFENSLTEKSRFPVISHGDFWNNNVLYRFNKNNVGEDIRLLDWQIVRFVSPAIDVVNKIFSSTDKAFRDKNYENLLQVYHKSLSKTVKLLGSDPQKLFSFDDFQYELKKHGCFVLLMAPMVIQTILADSSEISNLDEMCDKMAKGEGRQEFITGLNETAKLEYDRRLNEVFEDIIDKLGYYHELN